MFFHQKRLINEIPSSDPDPAAANALQEGLGGQFGEMRTMMQYLFQSFNFRGDALQFKDLIQAVAIEEISHVELIATTISQLLDGSPGYKPNGSATPGAGGATPLAMAMSTGNIHHYLVGAQGALPVDSAGNPWSGSYVYNSGNLPLDLLYNLMVEATGRLQKCRIYEMTDNPTARATISYLIVRDHAHQLTFARALEALGVDWGKLFPIPEFDASKYPEVKELMDKGLHLRQHHFRLDDSLLGELFVGPAADGSGDLDLQDEPPKGAPMPLSPERIEEFSPGLSDEMKKMMDELVGAPA